MQPQSHMLSLYVGTRGETRLVRLIIVCNNERMMETAKDGSHEENRDTLLLISVKCNS